MYTVIDSIATATGDKQTAKLARDIMRQEERMQQFLCEAELAEQHFERGRTVKQEIGHALHKHVERDGDSGDGDGEQAWMRITPATSSGHFDGLTTSTACRAGRLTLRHLRKTWSSAWSPLSPCWPRSG